MVASLIVANLLLLNGKVWTGDNGFVQAVAIEGNRIIATGTNESVIAAAPRDAKRIDLRGRLAVPGFIDNHVHFVDGGMQLSRVRLRDAATPEEFARRIADYARKSGSGKWVVGGEWDEQLWMPYRLPTKAMVDATTPHNPVFVSRLDGHMALANSVALKLAGITRESKDPPGGTIVRDQNGEPTGLLKDAAMAAVAAVIPPATLEERVAAARAGLKEAARFGVTAFCDMSSGTDAFADLRTYQRLEKAGELTSRVYLFTPISEHARLGAAAIERSFGSDRLRIGALKGFSDGSLGSSTAGFYEPFEGEPDNRGLMMRSMDSGDMKKWVHAANAVNLQIGIHAIGDRANDEVLTIFESVPDFRNRRFRIEHAQHLNDKIIKRFAADRVIASMQPYHAIDDGRWAEKVIGPERAKGTYAFRGLRDSGARLAFGSDWFVAPPTPLEGIYAAVTRRTLDDKNPGGWVPEQRITVEDALRAYTSGSAYASFDEKNKGTLERGKLADLVIIDRDLTAIPPETIRDAQVMLTMVGGRLIYEKP